jgi:signal transduction histidine kinase
VQSRTGRWVWPLVAVIVATAIGLARHVLPLDVAAGAAVVLFIVAAALATNGYRTSRDPGLLFVAVGAGVLGAQLLIFRLIWEEVQFQRISFIEAPGSVEGGLDAVPQHAVAIGLLVFAGCLVLVFPWWERRGRPPVLAIRVVGVAAGATLVADLLLLVFPATPKQEATVLGTGLAMSPLAAAISLVAAGLLAFALVRSIVAGGTTWHFAVGAAVSSGIFATVAPFLSRTSQESFSLGVVWTRVQPLPTAAFLVAGLIAAQHVETSRMRRASDRADEVLGGRAEIASMVAHEVRGPVAAIKGLAATTTGTYDRLSDEERLEFVGLIEQEATRLLDVVDKTSLALKVDAETITLDRRQQDLAPIVHEATAKARTNGRAIEIDAAGDVKAVVDRRWLGEAIRQAVDNAVTYSPAGAPVRVRLRGEDGSAWIEVIDAGPGVPPERRDEVFTKFVKWRPSGFEDRPGAGLGLFICRGLVRELGGEASVEDGPGGGTMLRIRLPAGGSG